ncbi:MAG: hypothetical protein IPL23_22020 [Saprospiraceae bacterium]|nr:hypothetical protein [Saprospiraceae bacterium]
MLSLIQVTDVLDVALELLDFPVPVDADALAAKFFLFYQKPQIVALYAQQWAGIVGTVMVAIGKPIVTRSSNLT